LIKFIKGIASKYPEFNKTLGEHWSKLMKEVLVETSNLGEILVWHRSGSARSKHDVIMSWYMKMWCNFCWIFNELLFKGLEIKLLIGQLQMV